MTGNVIGAVCYLSNPEIGYHDKKIFQCNDVVQLKNLIDSMHDPLEDGYCRRIHKNSSASVSFFRSLQDDHSFCSVRIKKQLEGSSAPTCWNFHMAYHRIVCTGPVLYYLLHILLTLLGFIDGKLVMINFRQFRSPSTTSLPLKNCTKKEANSVIWQDRLNASSAPFMLSVLT